MTDDPLDRPPADHGSDRYGYVELVGAPPNVNPPNELVDSYLDGGACMDCNPNLFFFWRPDEPTSWHVEIAHDEACPTFLRLEREGKLGEGPHVE